MIPHIHSVVSNLRPHLLKAAIVSFSSASILAAGGCSFFSTPLAKGPKSAAVPHIAGSAINIDTRNGSVEIIAETSRSDVRIDANFKCAGATQQEADQRLAQATIEATRDTSGVLTIKPAFPGGPQSNDGAAFVIRLPDANGVTINSSNGSVTLAALKGDLRITTSNGPIKVADHFGDAVLISSNGKIAATNMSGKVQANTSNGPIEVALASTSTGPVTLDTSNGPIMLRVGAAFLGEMHFKTSNGVVEIHGDANALRTDRTNATVMLGSGGEQSNIKTSNGSIDFTIQK